MKLITVRLPHGTSVGMARYWCNNNCVGKWYSCCSDWGNWVVGEDNNIFQFASESDATLFALRWS